jgi:hypothetical protein
VNIEREHVDNQRDHNQADDPEDKVCGKINLSKC